jgi:hypothetical protein
VTLTSDTLAYGIFTMKDGTTLALPEYLYTGTVSSSSTPPSSPVQARVVPIESQYLDFKNVTVTSGPCNVC